MGLTDIQKRLIQAISQNDMMSTLESTGSNLFELPHELKNVLCVEDVTNSFHEGRYYLSDREKAVYDNIVRMKKVSEKLMLI